MSENGPCQNTDRELWRERPGDYYADSLFVTERGGIGMNVSGFVIVKPIREWHRLAALAPAPDALRAALEMLVDFHAADLASADFEAKYGRDMSLDDVVAVARAALAPLSELETK